MPQTEVRFRHHTGMGLELTPRRLGVPPFFCDLSSRSCRTYFCHLGPLAQCLLRSFWLTGTNRGSASSALSFCPEGPLILPYRTACPTPFVCAASG